LDFATRIWVFIEIERWTMWVWVGWRCLLARRLNDTVRQARLRVEELETKLEAARSVATATAQAVASDAEKADATHKRQLAALESTAGDHSDVSLFSFSSVLG
jgi:hypothetical protein